MTKPRFTSLLVPEAALVLASLAAVAAKVGADAGGPSWILPAAQATALGVLVALLARRRRRWVDAPRAVLIGLALGLLPTVYGQVGGDGVQAFVVVRSAVLDGDLDLANDYRGLGARAVATETGTPTSHLPAGLALLWTPPFLAAHAGTALASALGAGVAADGFSVPYRSAVTAGSYLYGVLALLLLEAELRRRHGRGLALIGALGIWFATPLHFYMTANPAMAHGASVAAATAFVVCWLRVRQVPSTRGWLALGLLGGLMTLVRLQDAVLLALPLADLGIRRPARSLGLAMRFVAGAWVLGLVQLAVWLRLYGTGFLGTILRVNLVGSDGGPHVLDLLFAARHGLLTWTPLYAVCIAGWLLWLRRELGLAALAIGGFALSVLVNASMQDWWGAEAFGQRRLLGLTPLFALGLGQALAFLRSCPLALLSGGVAALGVWNLAFERIYNSEVVSRRDQPVSLDRLAPAQVEGAWRWLLSLHGRLPPTAWALAYDNLKGIWLDDGPRSLGGRIDLGAEPPELPLLVGHGWYPPEAEGAVTFRRSRGRGSWMRVPIRAPAAYRVLLRLRPEMEGPLSLTVEANRQPVGTADLVPGWSEYSFRIPAGLLRPGLNDLGLAYSSTPREAQPGVAGRNAAVSVDWLVLAREPGP
ncbi:MAG TPA: hypothetical protein VJU18_20155 [Vicinamibacteria bacterium]|nr:hypothetical protein [Vicinamibacteria bacterium]